ncbi:hypothetical protein [Mariprofundus ferrooxydans]|uniref:Uncharacterized protein n=1 Tax=Mariprofundus ferrooxydans PV-1 TaxID=314345 RepID=Q0F367_9PROT|nr:hypothetical protein [Mariprofundus ferrooxydans]EAU56074.1 hypothetical protein SPV1_04618 [Mariprofundus ferrooxydans PV-1]KON46654.1 hypothetical protein AL013_12145 [Mariprofundus ferrooxydans]
MKQKGKIEDKPGSLVPVNRGLWNYAFEKLVEAKAGIQQMDSASDRVAFEAGWIRFVDSLEEFWTSFFDEGKEKFSSFQPWAGKFRKERKDDPLLQYLIQARHQSQHGRIPLKWQEGAIAIAPGYFGHIRNMKIFQDGSFEVETNPLGKAHNQVKLVHEPGKPLLPVIENKKHKQRFDPPSSHLGQPIGNTSPIYVASLGLKYYETVLRSALAKFNG